RGGLARTRSRHAAPDRGHRRRSRRRGRHRADGAVVRARRLSAHIGSVRHLDRAGHGLARDRGGATPPAHRRGSGGTRVRGCWGVSAVVGLLVVKITGPGVFAAALAVGLAMVAMHLTKTFHPPAGIDPLVVVLNDMSWSFLLAPVAVGACLLAALAFVWHNL